MLSEPSIYYTMSTNFSGCGVVPSFYGDPQHETGTPTDAERVGVSTPTPQSERALYDYARRSCDRKPAAAGAFSADAQTA
jgi:hypothetical protein